MMNSWLNHRIVLLGDFCAGNVYSAQAFNATVFPWHHDEHMVALLGDLKPDSLQLCKEVFVYEGLDSFARGWNQGNT